MNDYFLKRPNLDSKPKWYQSKSNEMLIRMIVNLMITQNISFCPLMIGLFLFSWNNGNSIVVDWYLN